jgi:hypothetical protein
MVMEVCGSSIAEKLSVAIAKSLKDAKPEALAPVKDDPAAELVLLSSKEMDMKNPVNVRMERYERQEAEMSAKNPMRHSSVIWTTPVGLPVCQPYRNYKTKTVSRG